MQTSEKPEKIFWPAVQVFFNHHSVSEGFKGRGDLEFQGQLQFDGTWSGSIRSDTPDSHLDIHSSARIVGRLFAHKVSVSGHLSDIEIECQIFHAKAGAKVMGRIRAQTLIIDEGALIEGRVMSVKEVK